MLSLSNVQPCAMPAVSLTGESGMTPGLIPLCLGEVAAANVVAEDQAVLNCRTLLLKWPLCTVLHMAGWSRRIWSWGCLQLVLLVN